MEQNRSNNTQTPASSTSKKPGKKAPFIQLLTNKNGRKMTKSDKQMAGSVVLVCILAAILVVAVKAFA